MGHAFLQITCFVSYHHQKATERPLWQLRRFRVVCRLRIRCELVDLLRQIRHSYFGLRRHFCGGFSRFGGLCGRCCGLRRFRCLRCCGRRQHLGRGWVIWHWRHGCAWRCQRLYGVIFGCWLWCFNALPARKFDFLANLEIIEVDVRIQSPNVIPFETESVANNPQTIS